MWNVDTSTAPPEEVPTKHGRHSVGTAIPKSFWILTSACSTGNVFPYCGIFYRGKKKKSQLELLGCFVGLQRVTSNPRTHYSAFAGETHLCKDKVCQCAPDSKLSDVGSHQKTDSFPSILKLIFSWQKSSTGVVITQSVFCRQF